MSPQFVIRGETEVDAEAVAELTIAPFKTRSSASKRDSKRIADKRQMAFPTSGCDI